MHLPHDLFDTDLMAGSHSTAPIGHDFDFAYPMYDHDFLIQTRAQFGPPSYGEICQPHLATVFYHDTQLTPNVPAAASSSQYDQSEIASWPYLSSSVAPHAASHATFSETRHYEPRPANHQARVQQPPGPFGAPGPLTFD